jgi:hypothetical protein
VKAGPCQSRALGLWQREQLTVVNAEGLIFSSGPFGGGLQVISIQTFNLQSTVWAGSLLKGLVSSCLSDHESCLFPLDLTLRRLAYGKLLLCRLLLISVLKENKRARVCLGNLTFSLRMLCLYLKFCLYR